MKMKHSQRYELRQQQQQGLLAGGVLSKLSSERRKVSMENQHTELATVPSLNVVQEEAHNVRRFGETFRTLYRWRDSVYRLLWRHMLIYYVLYVSLTLLYEYNLNEDQKKIFRQVSKYVKMHQSSLNLMLMLGFFTSAALQRMFNTHATMPGIAKVISTFVFSLKPDLPEGKEIVEKFSRWSLLSWLLTFRLICKPLRTLFPDLEAIKREGLITEQEVKVLKRKEIADDTTPRPLIVVDWMLLLLKDSSRHERYFHRSGHGKCIEAVMLFKKSCGNTIRMATRNMPHPVIQSVIIAVYFYGLITILARDICYGENRQYSQGNVELSLGIQNLACLHNNGTANEEFVFVNRVFSYFPIFPGMQFFIFISWLTFGRAAVNPFGDDYTDIDITLLLASHVEDWNRLKKLYEDNFEDVFNSSIEEEANQNENIGCLQNPKEKQPECVSILLSKG